MWSVLEAGLDEACGRTAGTSGSQRAGMVKGSVWMLTRPRDLNWSTAQETAWT